MRMFVVLALLLLSPGAVAQESAAVAQLRRLLGDEVQLAFDRAAEVAGATVLTGVTLRRQNEVVRIVEARLEGLREDGITRLGLRGISVPGGDIPVTIEGMALEGLAIRRPAGGKVLAPEHVSADLLRIEGWRSEGPVPVRIGGVIVERFGGNRPGQANVTALEVRTPDMGVADRLSIARMGYAGLDAAELLGAIIAQRTPRRSPGQQSLEIEGVALTQGSVVVARLGALTLRGDITAGRPHTGGFAMRGLEVMPTPPLTDWMQRLGYARLGAEALLDASHDVAAQLLEVTRFSIELSDGGALGLTLRADQVPEEMTATQAQSARLISARLRYEDRSLLQRWIRNQASQQGITEAALRQQLVQASAAAMPGQRFAEARGAMARFLSGDVRVLELTAQPRAPLRLSQISGKPQSGLEGWRDMLGLVLTAR